MARLSLLILKKSSISCKNISLCSHVLAKTILKIRQTKRHEGRNLEQQVDHESQIFLEGIFQI